MGVVFHLPTKYKIETIIGKAGPHPVCSAVDKETGKSVAVIKMTKSFHNLENARDTCYLLKNLRHITHKNIVPILEIIPPLVDGSDEFYLVYEKMPSTLNSAIYSRPKLPIKHVLYQILCGMKYVDYRSPMLYNLNLNNVLLDEIDNASVEVKLSDYHMGDDTETGTGLTIEYAEPSRYRAPEVILAPDDLKLNACPVTLWPMCSMWSLGCIFTELLTRKPLFPGNNNLGTFEYILKQLGNPTEDDIALLDDTAKKYLRSLPVYKRQSLTKKFPNVDLQAIDLVTRMIAFDPLKRISVQEALKHPYLAEMPPSSDRVGPLLGNPARHSYSTFNAFGYGQLKDMVIEELNSYKMKPKR